MRSKKVIKNIIALIIQEIITLICGLIVPRAIIKAFGSNVNGLISSITQFLTYITLLEMGIGPVIKSALYKPIANKDKKEIEKILKAGQNFFRIISAIFIIYLIILCVIYPYIVLNEFDTLFTISIIIIIAISTFAEYYYGMIYKLYLQAEQKAYITTNIYTITTALNSILVIVLIKFGCSIQIVKLSTTFLFVLRSIIQNIYVKEKYKINLQEVKEVSKLEQKWDGLAQHIAHVIYSNADIIIITLFLGVTEVSVYAVYMLVFTAFKQVLQTLSNTIDSTFGDMLAKSEMEDLNKHFRLYEFIFYTIITIIYSMIAILILPFVRIYTLGFSDALYYRPVFAILLIIAELIYIMRNPYNMLIKAAGHFKQTQYIAWIETISKLILSTILIIKFGINGLVIGTILSVTTRTTYFIYYVSKHMLKRSIMVNIKNISALMIEALITIPLGVYITKVVQISSFFILIEIAVVIGIITSLIILLINIIVYREEFKNLLFEIKNLFNNIKAEKNKEKISNG